MCYKVKTRKISTFKQITAVVAVNIEMAKTWKGENAMSQEKKLIAMVVENLPELPTEIAQAWIGDPTGLKAFLGGLSRAPQRKFEVWKTVWLGTATLTSGPAFVNAIVSNSFGIEQDAESILILGPGISIAGTMTKVNLIKATVAEMGFAAGALRGQIYKRAVELGWQLCPAEVGPQLRLQSRDQKRGCIHIGMEPIKNGDVDGKIFAVENTRDSLMLSTCNGGINWFWGPGSVWVFVKPDEPAKK